MHDATGTCTPLQPCHRWKHCDYCARLRQARIAELAASRCRHHEPTYAVITGLDARTVIDARKFHAGTGGMWTIEIGEKMHGLHANLILDASAPVTAEQIASTLNRPSSAVWAQAITRADLRNVAAYISKRAGAPRWQEFDGRLYGTWGTWRGVGQIARDQTRHPAVTAAATELQLRQLGIQPPQPPTHPAAQLNDASSDPKTLADYRAIAYRHLAALRQIVDK